MKTLAFLFAFTAALPAFANRNFGVTTTLASFSNQAINVESMTYDIDSKLLTSLEGSFKITKRFNGLLNVNFDSKEVDKTFQVLGLIASKDMVFQITSGKLTGSASLSTTVLTNPVSFTDNFENKYLAADFLFRMKADWVKDAFGCDEESGSCYHGIRLIKYQVPVELLLSGRFGGSDFEDAPSLLDPAFDVFGVMYTISINQLRDFTREDTETEEAKDSRFAFVTVTSLGYAVGSASDQAKTNLNTLEAGTTFEDDSQGMITFDSMMAVYYTWKWSKKSSRWLLAAGYMGQLNLALNPSITTGDDAPADASQVRIDKASPGYVLHGPSLAFFGTF